VSLADSRRLLEHGVVRGSLAASLGVPHSYRHWRAKRYLEAHATARLNAFTKSMWEEAADAVGAVMTEIAPGLWQFTRGTSFVHIVGQRTPFANPVAIELANAKDLAYGVLRGAGVPIADHVVVTSDRKPAFELLDRTGGPVVAKPARDGGAGLGVTTSITTRKQLARALRRGGLTSTRIVVEREVAGEHYRILLLDGEVLDIIERRRPSVIGDGVATIQDLMFAEFERRALDEHSWKPFPVDLDCMFTLERQGIPISHVPEAGELVVVKGATNISGSRDCSTYQGSVAPEVESVVRRAAAALGVRLAGVDVVTPDPGVPLAASGGVVLEVNPVPGLFHHYHVSNGNGASRIAIPILDALLTQQASPEIAQSA
jgi:cyanophycin synthetase